MSVLEQIQQLRQELHQHNYNYYVLNQPTISDYDFDMLMHKLEQLEAEHPEYSDENSPTQRVGSDLNQQFKQVAHKYPMLSLSNTYNEDDVRDFYRRVDEGLNGEPFEIIADDIQGTFSLLGEVIGETYTEDLLDEIFSKFCVGK